MGEYGNDPESSVVFIEQDVDSPIDGTRTSRWWAANGYGSSVYLPLILIDSGDQFSSGPVDYATVYKGMIDSALTRLPGAAISAVVNRVDNSLHFTVEVTNLSGVALSSTNSASLYALVYDDESISGLTGSYVVASVREGISPLLASGDSATYSIQVDNLPDPDSPSLRAVVFLDYRPAGVNHYDMLQVAVEREEPLKKAMISLLVAGGGTPQDVNTIEDSNGDGKIGLAEAIHFIRQAAQ